MGVALFGGVLLFIVMALVFSNILTGALSQILYDISMQIIYINVMLFIFNLLPLPGLDGWSVFRDLSPKHFYRISDKVYQYQFIILIAIVVVGAPIISIPVKFVSNQIINIVQLLLMTVF